MFYLTTSTSATDQLVIEAPNSFISMPVNLAIHLPKLGMSAYFAVAVNDMAYGIHASNTGGSDYMRFTAAAEGKLFPLLCYLFRVLFFKFYELTSCYTIS